MTRERMVLIGMLVLTVALAGCVEVVLGTVTQMGVFDSCEQMQPRFTGADVRIADWAFTDTNQIAVSVQAVNDVTVTEVRLSREQGDAWTWSGNQQLSSHETATVTLQGSDISSGDCLVGDVEIKYHTEQRDDLIAHGEGTLQGKAP